MCCLVSFEAYLSLVLGLYLKLVMGVVESLCALCNIDVWSISFLCTRSRQENWRVFQIQCRTIDLLDSISRLHCITVIIPKGCLNNVCLIL